MSEGSELENGSRSFSFELDIHSPVTFIQSFDNNLILFTKGRFRLFTQQPVKLGGADVGNVNLGFRLYDENLRQIFEDRASLSLEKAKPSKWYEFRVQVPRKPEIFSARYIELNFVSEGKFWFDKDLGAIRNRQVKFDAPTQAPNQPPANPPEKTPAPLTAERIETSLASEDAMAPEEAAEEIVVAAPPQVQKSAPSVPEGQVGRFIFDISDLVQFWRSNIRPTGIQRVQIEVLKCIIEKKIADTFIDIPFIVVTYDENANNWLCLSLEFLFDQIKLSAQPKISEADWSDRHATLMKSTVYYAPSAMDAIVNIGSSWWIPDYLHKIQVLKYENEVRYIPFIHDAIPLVTPEFCDANLVEEFQLWFRGAVTIADGIVVNSLASEADVRRLAMSFTGGCPDIAIARLNAVFPRPPSSMRTGIRERYNLDIERYVLCVGTLEARKNHAMLLQVWAEMSRLVPKDRQARLVLVGKEGWMFDAAEAVLRRYPGLKKSVLTLNNLSDQELEELYRNCAFTVYPSFYEGWGLPVTEAVSYGKLTVASTSSSIPEAASPGDILLNPREAGAWRDTIVRLLTDDEFLAAQTQASQSQGRLRGWHDIANDILAAAHGSPLRHAERVQSVVQDGTIYDFRIETARKNYSCSAMPFRAGSGWHHCEDWGAWSGPGVTELKFRFASVEDRFCYLVLQGAGESVDFTLTVGREQRLQRSLGPGERVILRVLLTAAPDAETTLRIVTLDPIDLAVRTNGADRRQIGVGFVSFCVAVCDDVVSRLNFNEAMQMQFC